MSKFEQVFFALRLLKPYFSFKSKNLLNIALLSGTFLLCLFRLLLVIIVADAGTVWFGMINGALLSVSSLILPTIALFCLLLPIDALSKALIDFLGSTLSTRISQRMNENMINRFYSKKTFHGIKTLKKAKGKNLSYEVLTKNIKQFNTFIFETATEFITISLSALIALYQLWVFSPTLIIYSSLLLPSYLPIFALMYGATIFLLIRKLSKPLYELHRKESRAIQNCNKQLAHTDTFSESIAFLKGGKFEAKELKAISHQRFDTRKRRLKYKFFSNLIKNISEAFSYPLGTLVCLPGLISGMTNVMIESNLFFSISAHFTKIVTFFTNITDNQEKWVRFITATNNIREFLILGQRWQRQYHNLQLRHQGNDISIKRVSIGFKKRKIIENQSVVLASGRTYLLSAPSGAGKSTLLRSLAGIQPNFSGEITLPENTIFIPQIPYMIRGKSTLIENITYPYSSDAYPKKILTKIPDWLKSLKLRSSLIDVLDTKEKNWNSILSPGEKQRIAIVRALLKKPQFLIMDEPTSAMGENYSQCVKTLIRSVLPTVTILYTDHHPKLKKEKEIVLILAPPKLRLRK